MLSFCSMWASEHRRGVERSRQALECLPLPDEGFWRGHGLLTESQLLLMLGELDGASARYALEIASDPLGLATINGYLGEIAGSAGEIVLARESLTAALELVSAAHFRQLQAWNLTRLAEVETAAGDLSRADALAREAFDLAVAIAFPYVRGRAERVRGEIALASAAVPEALKLLTSAAAQFERIEAPYEWARTAVSLAAALAADGEHQRARHLHGRALDAASRMGASLPGVGGASPTGSTTTASTSARPSRSR